MPEKIGYEIYGLITKGEAMVDKDYTNIPIPNIIIHKIQEQIKGTEFKSVAEYIIFILREVLEDKDEKAGLTPDEESQVKDTLKKLGYLKDT